MEKRIPSLDGARAVSILLVVASHLSGEVWLDYGNLGVRTFFVISGFLITSLLLQEHARTNTISLKHFYLRRLFRIGPVYYVFLVAIALLIPTRFVFATYDELLPALVYYSNYHWTGRSLFMTWSLSVEEQFYLLWPIAIALLGLGRAKRCCIAILLIAPVFRVLCDLHCWPSPIKTAFECNADALAIGCLLALFRDRLWNWSVYRRMIESGFAILPLAVALVVMVTHQKSTLSDAIGLSFLNGALALALDRFMRFPKDGLARALNWRPVVWIGTISYSLYLWQQMFTFGKIALPIMTKLVCSFALAAISYYWVERPALMIRRKIETTMANRACPSTIDATA